MFVLVVFGVGVGRSGVAGKEVWWGWGGDGGGVRRPHDDVGRLKALGDASPSSLFILAWPP